MTEETAQRIARSLEIIAGQVNPFESDSYPTSGEIKDTLAEVLPRTLFVSDTHRETTAGYLMGELLRRFVIKRKVQ